MVTPVVFNACVDSAKYLAVFSRNKGEDIESWCIARHLYFAVDESLTKNQRPVRMVLNLAGVV